MFLSFENRKSLFTLVKLFFFSKLACEMDWSNFDNPVKNFSVNSKM